MRFAFLVAGGVAAGALSVGGVRTLVPPNAQMFQAVRALGGNMADFKLGDIDPLKAYEDVRRQITSGNLSGSLNLGSAPQITFSKPGTLSIGSKMQPDDGVMRRAIAAGINSQIQQSNRRMDEMSGYTRNPAGWHGMPPH
jgi:hypothetical protein